MKYREKLKSRKFQVFAIWTVLSIVSLFQPDLPKETIFQYYGLVSMIYISANALTAKRTGGDNDPCSGQN